MNIHDKIEYKFTVYDIQHYIFTSSTNILMEEESQLVVDPLARPETQSEADSQMVEISKLEITIYSKISYNL